MKKAVFGNSNKMAFESPLVIFNQQTNLIATGNMIANTQYSNQVRPYVQTTCGTLSWETGYLREFDLCCFQEFGVSKRVLREVRELTQEEGGYLYVFYHYSVSARHRIIDGVVLTRDDKRIKTWYVNQDWRAEAAVNEATKYIVEEDQPAGKE